MARIFIGMGSNVEREKHIRAGARALRDLFANARFSTVYQNAAVGFAGADFYNLVIGADTDHDATAAYHLLRRIEDKHGRDRSQPRFSPRTLDLDLLLYDDLVIRNEWFQIPRDDIEKYAFVLCPLAEIAGERMHPVLGKTFARLWREWRDSERPAQPLRPVDLDLRPPAA